MQGTESSKEVVVAPPLALDAESQGLGWLRV